MERWKVQSRVKRRQFQTVPLPRFHIAVYAKRRSRKPKLTDHQKCEAIKRRDRDGETLAEIGRSWGGGL
jgi:hypothetical protein